MILSIRIKLDPSWDSYKDKTVNELFKALGLPEDRNGVKLELNYIVV